MRLIGREEERERISTAARSVAAGSGATLLVEGGPGIGKTVLVGEARRISAELGLRVLEGSCHPHSEPYHPFVSADHGFREILQPDRTMSFDEIFLIYKNGVLISHLSNVSTKMDEDILGGMLSAVQDFVRDSFGDASGKGALKKMEYGETSIMIENGDNTFIACVLRGKDTAEMRDAMAESLYAIEGMVSTMPEWTGDMELVAPMEPHLRALLNRRFAPTTEMSQADLESMRVEMLESSLAHLGEMTSVGPLALLIEDLHWADEHSMALLDHLSRNVPGRALIIASYRPEEVAFPSSDRDEIGDGGVDRLSAKRGEHIASMAEAPGTERIQVPPFDEGETRLQIEVQLGGRPSSKLVKEVYGHTKGNPFFSRELASHLKETGAAHLEDGLWQLTAIPGAPGSVQTVITRRIERLSEREMTVLEFASSLGREFDGGLVAQALGIDAGRHMAHFVDQGFLSTLPGVEGGYEFYHAITHDVVYSGIGERRRKAYHKIAGEAYERSDADGAQRLFSLAYHFTRSSDMEKALTYCYEAGEAAFQAYAPGEAFSYFSDSLDALSNIPQTESIMKRRTSVLLKVSEAALLSARFDDVARYAGEARELATSLGLRSQAASALKCVGDMCLQIADYGRGEEVLKGARSLFGEAGDRRGYISSTVTLANLMWRVGKCDDAMAVVDEAWPSAQKLGDPRLQGNLLLEKANIYGDSGRLREAVTELQRALEYLEPAGDLLQSARAYNNLADTYIYLEGEEPGALQKALECADKAIDLVAKANTPYFLFWFLGTKGEILLKLGEIDKGIAIINQCIQFSDRMKDNQSLSILYYLLGRAYRLKGEFDVAEDNLERALSMSERLDRLYYMGCILNEYAELHRERGESERAREKLERALGIAEKIGAEHLKVLIRGGMERLDKDG